MGTYTRQIIRLKIHLTRLRGVKIYDRVLNLPRKRHTLDYVSLLILKHAEICIIGFGGSGLTVSSRIVVNRSPFGK